MRLAIVVDNFSPYLSTILSTIDDPESAGGV
jgi:hypothetical protein